MANTILNINVARHHQMPYKYKLVISSDTSMVSSMLVTTFVNKLLTNGVVHKQDDNHYKIIPLHNIKDITVEIEEEG